MYLYVPLFLLQYSHVLAVLVCLIQDRNELIHIANFLHIMPASSVPFICCSLSLYLLVWVDWICGNHIFHAYTLLSIIDTENGMNSYKSKIDWTFRIKCMLHRINISRRILPTCMHIFCRLAICMASNKHATHSHKLLILCWL